jgi:hypothetical protein
MQHQAQARHHTLALRMMMRRSYPGI